MRRITFLICAAMLATAALGLVVPSAASVLPSGSAVRIATVDRPAPRLPATIAAPRTFQLVGASWKGRGGLEVRAGKDGSWTAWAPLVHESPTWTDDATMIQLRRARPGAVTDLKLAFITSPPVAASMSAQPAVAGRPPIITRAGWGANESIRRGPPLYAPSVKMIFVHHTDTATVYPCADSPRIIRAIYAYHVLSNGWNDIGYNFLIDRCGRVFEGRYGGTTRPVIGAHTLGMNTSSSGIAMIGTFSSVRPTTTAVSALERLIAWRLDIAHDDPLGHALMVSGGNEYFHPGQHVVLRVVSGHRDGSATSCPGAALYAMLPAIARAASQIGLPKIYYPRTVAGMTRMSPGQSRPVHFLARFSHTTRWTLRVIGPGGITIVTHTGTGSSVNWTWNGVAPVLPGGAYHWTLTAPGASPTSRALGAIRDWIRAAHPDAVGGGVISGGPGSLQAVDGNVLSAASFTTVSHVPVTAVQFAHAKTVGASIIPADGGQPVTMELWDFASNRWVTAGTCPLVAGERCTMTVPAGSGTFGQRDAGTGTMEVRARYTAENPMSVDLASSIVTG
jgi:hypothetical protein